MSDNGQPNDAPATEAEVRAALNAAVGERLSALRLASGNATVVLEVGGLSQLERDKLDIAARAALSPFAFAKSNIAMTAEREAGAPPPPETPRRPRLIAVGSGKGGVGKSTLSANLAVAMHRAGRKVGLVDADIYGPSQPRLMATEGQRPEAREKTMLPVMSPSGVPMLSMGHLVEPGQAIAWRGPMAGNALGQLIEADWGECTDLVLDLPPGTGDVQLTMVQKFKPIGAVIVSTPQDLALMDATRAIGFFDQAKVPIIGVVENMAGYVCPHCGEASDPFGSGGAEAAARTMGHDFLGRIPLTMAIRQESDAGHPPAGGEGVVADSFAALARHIGEWIDARA